MMSLVGVLSLVRMLSLVRVVSLVRMSKNSFDSRDNVPETFGSRREQDLIAA